MVELLSTQQLNNLCESMIIRIHPADFKFLNYITYLYLTGSRPRDFYNPGYLVTETENQIVVQPPKNNNTRVINKTNIAPMILHYMRTGEGIYSRKDYRTFLRKFQRLFDKSDIKVSKRPLDLYIFRYNYVRTLHENGSTPEQIQVIMGWKSIGICNNYISRPITLHT